MFIAIFITSVILCWFFKNEFRKIQLAWNFPGPTALPFIGNGLDLINKSSIEFVQIVRRYIREHGKFLRIWLGNQLVLIFMDPKDVQVILTDMKLISKAQEYKFLEPWLQTGLLTSTNQKWIKRRKILTPAFHFKILEEFLEVFDNQGNILVEKLKGYDGQVVDMFPVVALCALDVICETAMGISLNSQSDSESEYVRNVNELADIIHRRTFDFVSRYDFMYRFTKTYKRQTELINSLHHFTESVIKTRRDELLANGENVVENDKKKKALLDLLLTTTIDGKSLTNSDIREEIDTFMFEGHDTTASGIAFALFSLAKHRDIQRKCYEEVQHVLGGNCGGEKLSMQKLSEMRYLELVVKESLRLYPSVPIFGRKATEELSINGRLIPKDATVLVLPYFMARDSSIWEKPLEFIPERHSAEKDNESSNPFAYVSFSAGSRNCIGQKFAMLEMKSTIAKIIQNFELSLEDNFAPQDSLELVIKSKNGIRIRLQSRN